MKNTFSPFAKLVAIAMCALTLGSCNRAEYAMLPKGGSYYGVNRAATPVPIAATPAAAVAEPVVATTPEIAPEAPVATVAPVAAVAPAAQPTKAQKATVVPVAAGIAATPAPKMNLVQRFTLNKVTRKVDKLMQKATARQHDNTASTSKTSAISGNLRTGLIFLLVGLLVSLFSGISGIFGIIGAIFAIIGLIFIILWLLDQA